MLIIFEGSDYSGKSTQIDRLCNVTLSKYCNGTQNKFKGIINLREPGSTSAGEKIRQLLLNQSEISSDSISAILMFEAARYENIIQNILPKIRDNYIVVCDRFLDSTLVYQGYNDDPKLQELNVKLITFIHNEVIMPLLSDVLTIKFVLQVDIDTVINRINSEKIKKKNDYDNKSIQFHKDIIARYQSLCCDFCQTFKVNANRSISELETEIKDYLRKFL